MNDSSRVFKIIHSTIQQSNNSLSLKALCSMAGVSRSGYYAWVKAFSTRSRMEQQDRDDYGSACTHESEKDPTTYG